MNKNTIVEICSSLLILLFFYAGLTKLFDYQTFQFQLGKSPYISNLSSVVAWVLPILEIVTGVFLMLKATKLFGLYLSLFLMSMFSTYIYFMLHYSYYIPCSCGGILSYMDWHTHFWFNIGFVGAALTGILLSPSSNKIEASKNPSLSVKIST